MHKRTKNPTSIFAKIVGLFLILTVIAIFVILHFALAKATITIYSSLEEKTANVLVEVQPEDVAEISPEAIFGKLLDTEFEHSVTVSTTQNKVAGTKAAGFVTVYNNYSQDQTLLATTRLLTPDSKLYRIQETIVVPSGQKVEVWAEADQEGREFVISPSTFIIPGLWEGLQDKIFAESFDSMELQSVPKFVIRQEDLDGAEEKFTAEAQQIAIDKINELLPDNLAITADKLILQFTDLSTAIVGTETTEFSISKKVSAQGLVFSDEDLLAMARQKFAKEVDGREDKIKYKDDTLSYEIIEINSVTNKAVLEVEIKANIGSGNNAWDLDKEKLIGLNQEEVERYLREEIDIDQAIVEFFPFWVKTVPSLKDHIIIE